VCCDFDCCDVIDSESSFTVVGLFSVTGISFRCLNSTPGVTDFVAVVVSVILVVDVVVSVVLFVVVSSVAIGCFIVSPTLPFCLDRAGDLLASPAEAEASAIFSSKREMMLLAFLLSLLLF